MLKTPVLHQTLCLTLVAALLATPAGVCSAPVTGETPDGSAANAHSALSKKSNHAAAPVLKGGVSETVSPFAADGSSNPVTAGTSFSLTMMANINSEVSKVGDEVAAMVSLDVKDKNSGKVLLPGFWCVHGTVNEVKTQRRGGRDGFVSVKFDRLISPDGKYQVPIAAVASTKDSVVKSVAKVVAKDSVMVGIGAAGGAIASVEWGGIPLAVATHGYSVAIGAGVGATLGLIAALKRKGKIASGLCGEELKFRIDAPIELPAFNEQALPSAMPAPKIDNLAIVVDKSGFRKNPWGDNHSRLLQVHFKMDNQTDRTFNIGNIVVVSDHNKMYYPYLGSNMRERLKSVGPKSAGEATITFDVDSNKRKYFLVLLDHGNTAELTRVPVN